MERKKKRDKDDSEHYWNDYKSDRLLSNNKIIY